MANQAPQPAMSGGLNQSDFGEQFSEQALQAAMQQKGSGGTQASPPSQKPPAQPEPPREMGTITEELITRPAQDIWKGLKSLLDVSTLLNINSQTDTPEEQAKKKAIHQRWQQLTQEQQSVAQQNYQKEMQRKQRMAEEDEMRRRQKMQAEANSVEMPSSPKKGPASQSGSQKQRTISKLEEDRKTLSSPQSAG